MNIPTKKLKNGFELPVYGLGLWQMGGRWEADTTRDKQEVEVIQAAIELGITHFDTAEAYGAGHAEELLGEAIVGYDRAKLLIATKVKWERMGYDDVLRACEASLKRLGTDYIDLYIMHSFPRPGTDIKDTLRALDELVEQGVIKKIGASNFTPNRLTHAQQLTANKIVCNQVHYNVRYREVEAKGVLKQCQDEDIMLVAWRPLQKGTLNGEPLLQQLAKKYNKTETQIMLNWLISQKNVVTISKTSNLNHLQENLGAIGWTMDEEDIELVRRDFPNQEKVSDAVPLDYQTDVDP